MIIKDDSHSYYGRIDDKVPSEKLGETLIKEIIMDVFKKNKKKIIENYDQIISELSKDLKSEIRSSVQKLNTRISVMSKKIQSINCSVKSKK